MLCPFTLCIFTGELPLGLSAPTERFEEVLEGLAITHQRTKEMVALLSQVFLVAPQRLQRALTPRKASIHAAASRADKKRGSPTAILYWMSVYDRIGLFDVDDCHATRLTDTALRYVWRKETMDAIVAAVGREGYAPWPSRMRNRGADLADDVTCKTGGGTGDGEDVGAGVGSGGIAGGDAGVGSGGTAGGEAGGGSGGADSGAGGAVGGGDGGQAAACPGGDAFAGGGADTGDG